MAADLRLVANTAERHPDELAIERARDRLADRGLARAGRPDQREDRARALVLLDPALLAQLADGEVLDDAVLDVLQPVVVGVEDLTSVLRVEALLRRLAPRHGEEPVEVRADHLRLGALLAHALEARELSLSLLANVLGQVELLELLPVLLDHGSVVVAELLADRVHLAPQDVLALLLLRAFLDVLADALPHLQGGEHFALQLGRELQPLAQVQRLEQAELLLERDVGRVADRVRKRSGIADRAQEGRDAAVVAAVVEDLLDDRAVLGPELAELRVPLLGVGVVLDLDAQLAARVALGRAQDAAMEAVQHDRAAAAGQPDRLDDLGNGADGRVLVLVVRDEEDVLLVSGVHRQRDGHVREDDGVLQRDQQQLHESLLD